MNREDLDADAWHERNREARVFWHGEHFAGGKRVPAADVQIVEQMNMERRNRGTSIE